MSEAVPNDLGQSHHPKKGTMKEFKFYDDFSLSPGYGWVITSYNIVTLFHCQEVLCNYFKEVTFYVTHGVLISLGKILVVVF